MSIIVKRFPELSTIILEFVPPAKTPDDPMMNMVESRDFKRELGRPIFRVIDISKVDMNFSDMTMAMATERGQEGGSDDPEVTTIFVGSGSLVEIGSKALAQQEQYGNAKVHLVTSQEEALEYIRQQSQK